MNISVLIYLGERVHVFFPVLSMHRGDCPKLSFITNEEFCLDGQVVMRNTKRHSQQLIECIDIYFFCFVFCVSLGKTFCKVYL